MIVYKVVSQTMDGKLWSWARGGLSTYYTVEYIEDVRVYPNIKGTFLFAFKTLEAARDFAGFSNSVWECEADIHDGPAYRGDLGLEEFFWSIYNSDYSIITKDRFYFITNEEHSVYIDNPEFNSSQSTIFCKSIKLLRKV